MQGRVIGRILRLKGPDGGKQRGRTGAGKTLNPGTFLSPWWSRLPVPAEDAPMSDRTTSPRGTSSTRRRPQAGVSGQPAGADSVRIRVFRPVDPGDQFLQSLFS
jgi:hypothetical protein